MDRLYQVREVFTEADVEDARLSELSPLLGESICSLQPSAYDSTTNEEG